MLNINKKAEPFCLKKYRSQEDACFSNITSEVNSELAKQMLEEQGYLCAYCMSRIHPGKIRREHCLSQDSHPNLALNYENILACCTGNEATQGTKQIEDTHCDVKKGSKDFHFNPANIDVESLIQYSLSDGMIKSNNAQLDKELNNILNLNFSRLKANRKAVIDRLRTQFARLNENSSREKVQKLYDEWTTRIDGQLPEYAGVALYFIRQRMKRAK